MIVLQLVQAQHMVGVHERFLNTIDTPVAQKLTWDGTHWKKGVWIT